MSEEQNELDAFFTSSNNTPQPEEKEISSSALEDEFSKLLNSFIEESNSSTASTNKSLDDFLGPTEEPKDTSSPSSLDSFVTTSAIKTQAIINKTAVSFTNVYFVPKILSPASPRPGTIYIWSLRHSSCDAA